MADLREWITQLFYHFLVVRTALNRHEVGGLLGMAAMNDETLVFEVFVDLSSCRIGDSWLLAWSDLVLESVHSRQSIFVRTVHSSTLEHKSTQSIESLLFGLAKMAFIAGVVIR